MENEGDIVTASAATLLTLVYAKDLQCPTPGVSKAMELIGKKAPLNNSGLVHS